MSAYPIAAATDAIVTAFRDRGLTLTPDAARQWVTAEQGEDNNILGVTYSTPTGRALYDYPDLAAGARAAANRVATLGIYAPLRASLRPGVSTGDQLAAIIASPWNRPNSPYYRRAFTGETGGVPYVAPASSSVGSSSVTVLFPITPAMSAQQRASVYVQRLQYLGSRGPLSAGQRDALARYREVASRAAPAPAAPAAPTTASAPTLTGGTAPTFAVRPEAAALARAIVGAGPRTAAAAPEQAGGGPATTGGPPALVTIVLLAAIVGVGVLTLRSL